MNRPHARLSVRSYPAATAGVRLHAELLEDRCLLNGSVVGTLTRQDALTGGGTIYDPTRILVRFAAGSAIPTAPQGLSLGARLDLLPGLYEVNLSPGQTVPQALAAYKTLPGVVDVRPDYQIRVQMTPNDPNYPKQWALNNTGQSSGTPGADISAPAAWDVTTGKGVTVAVLDTGIDYTHSDLKSNIWTNVGEIAGNGIDDDHNGFVDDIHGYDFANSDSDPMDDVGHGTHVAGIIGAVGNNAGGVAGVAWNVRLMAVKFLGADGTGYVSDAFKALNYAISNGARISNNSWNVGPIDDLFQEALITAAASGHLFVTAAGNNSNNNDLSPVYPANYTTGNILSVAATDSNDQLAGFSNYGAKTVHLAAPGVDVLSTVPKTGSLGDASGLALRSGTSVAAPFVTGVAALVLSQHPEWRADRLIQQILSTADPLPSLTGKTISGGRLNAARAVGASAADTQGAHITDSSPSGPVMGPISRIRLTFSEPISLGTFTTADIVQLSGPNGAISTASVTISEVTGSGGRAFDVAFPSQATAGTYTLVVGPQILDRTSPPNAMDQNGNGIKGEVPGDRYTATFTIATGNLVSSTDVPLGIVDGARTVSTLEITQDLRIQDLNVRLSISHAHVSDLNIYLVSPQDTTVSLAIGRGGVGQNFQGTVFDDQAGLPISQGSAPFAGRYQPEGPLAALSGKSARGTWKLVIEDLAPFHQGTLTSWGLDILGNDASSAGNGAPTAVDDYSQTNEDTPKVLDVLLNDSDPNGDPLTVSVLQTVSGQAYVYGDGSVGFIPDKDFVGVAGFTYSISDGRGGTATAQAYIQVLPVNDPPIAGDDATTTGINEPLLLSGDPALGFNLLANDSDPDGDRLTLVGVENVSNGNLVFHSNGTATFTPTPGFSGIGSFEYIISDGTLTARAQVSVSIRSMTYISTVNNGTLVGGDGRAATFTRSDILRVSVEGSNTNYEIYFRASNVGLTTATEDVDAFTLLADGSILISTSGAFSVPGPNGTTLTGAGEDILRFVPQTLGVNTSGSWSMYFDGSDVGLLGSLENIDALALLPDGRILISTSGAVSVPGVGGADTDLLVFTPRTLGVDTSGTWAIFLDGSDVGLTDNSAEDIDAVWVKPAAVSGGLPTIALSFRGNFTVPGATGAGEDVITFQPKSLGANTAGTWSNPLALDGSLYNLAPCGLDGLWMGAAPSGVRAQSLPPGAGNRAPSQSGGNGAALAASLSKPNSPGSINLIFSQAGLPRSATLLPGGPAIVGTTPSSQGATGGSSSSFATIAVPRRGEETRKRQLELLNNPLWLFLP